MLHTHISRRQLIAPPARILQPTDTSAASTGDEKPFPFLSLPAELRNRIYEHAISEEQVPAWLYHSLPCYHRCNNDSYIGLNTACKQTRVEFRPLFYHDAEIVIRLRDLPAFLRTFFPETAKSDTSIVKVSVQVESDDISSKKKWNALPLLQAKVLNRHVQWEFEPIPSIRGSYSWAKTINDSVQLCDLFNKAVNYPKRSFWGDIRSGIISEMVLGQAYGRATRNRDWELIVRKKEGRLDQQEKINIEKYCKGLAISKWFNEDSLPLRRLLFGVKNVVGIKIFVSNACGSLVEKYVWDAETSRMEIASGTVHRTTESQGGRAGRSRW